MSEETFPDRMKGLREAARRRRVRLVFDQGEALPPPDCDLDALAASPVPADPDPLPPGHSSHARKLHELTAEFAGQSQLALTNAILIAHLRKRAWPDHAPQLFRRLWQERSDHLIAELSPRWLISSLITFADHGETEADRRIGLSMGMLFSLMKLYEAERQYSGLPADQPFGLTGRKVSALPLDMRPFGLVGGDLEVQLLAPLITGARLAPVAGGLAAEILDRLNRDSGNLFRRLRKMRERRVAHRRTRVAPEPEPAPDEGIS